jgi:hypothetical protein
MTQFSNLGSLGAENEMWARGSGTEFSLSMTQSESIMHLQLDLPLSRKF